jgi:hypothetical protein
MIDVVQVGLVIAFFPDWKPYDRLLPLRIPGIIPMAFDPSE